MSRTTKRTLVALTVLLLGWSRVPAAETIRGDLVSVTVDQGRFAIQARGRAVPFATGVLRCQGAVKVAPIDDAVFGKGQAIAVTGSHGGGETFQVFAGLPFVLYEVTLVNSGATACA